MSRRIQLVGVVASVTLAAGGLAALDSSASAATAHPAVASAHAGVKVSLHHTSKGRVLAGPNGHSLYNFTLDTKNHSNCDSNCRAFWHPLKSRGKPRAGTGVKQRLLGRTSSHQVTYRGRPLYYYILDTRAGQIHGEDRFLSGGYWYLMNAKGRSVR